MLRRGDLVAVVVVAVGMFGAPGVALGTPGPAGSLASIAGTNRFVAPGAATATPIGAEGVAVDGSGNVYIADYYSSVVEKVTPSGTVSIIAGIPGKAGAPTAGPATSSHLQLGEPAGLAVDSAGNLYIADQANEVVEKVTPSGTLSIIAGIPGKAGAPTAGPATSSELDLPSGVAVDSSGNVYIADLENNVVERVTPSGTLSVYAGTGASGAPTPGPATHSDLNGPAGLAMSASGTLYIADTYNHVVEKVTPSGTLSIIAGTSGQGGSPSPGPATGSELDEPESVAVDSSGNVYISDAYDFTVDKVTPSGTLSILAGTPGQQGAPTPGAATSGDLAGPAGVAVDGSGDVYIADGYFSYGDGSYSSYFDGGYYDFTVEKVTSSGTLSVFAGRAYEGPPTPGAATTSDLNLPRAVALDSAGDVYIADSANDEIEKVTPAGTLSIEAGTGSAGAPKAGQATDSPLFDPEGVAVDSSGDVYIADSGYYDVEKVTPSGTVSVVAGDSEPGAPTAGPATHSDLGTPSGIAVDGSGDLYIADRSEDVVEKVTPLGTLSVLAGVSGSSGAPTAGIAADSKLNDPTAVAVDSSGNVYIADTGNDDVEKVTPSGTLSILAGTGSSGPPTAGPATSSPLISPRGVAVDSSGNVFISNAGVCGECFSEEVVQVTPSGTLSIIAGGSFDGPGPPTTGPAIGSDFNGLEGLGVDSSGNVYVADTGNDDIEELYAPFPGSTTPGMDPTSTSVNCSPTSVAVQAASTCTATVTDTATSGPSTPTGSVSFSAAPSTGTFGGSGTCSLSETGTTGVGSCQVSFMPSVAGSYTITGGYLGDSTHQASDGLSSTLTAANSSTGSGLGGSSGSGAGAAGGASGSGGPDGGTGGPGGASPPGAGRSSTATSCGASIGRAKVKGSTATVPVKSSGTKSCTLKLTVSLSEKVRHGHRTTHKTVILGSAKITIAAGKSKTVRIRLNQAGRRLLTQERRLKAKLALTEAGQTVRTASVTFKMTKTKQRHT
jgi:sugar lactone lactonase YvrE